MLRLSQRAWNNVLIFAMLFMVYLFAVSDNLINNDDVSPQSEPLLPPYSVIMKLDYGYVAIERIGQDWRVSSEREYSVDSITPLVSTWESLQVLSVSVAPTSNPHIVAMLVAGESAPRVYQVFEEPTATILRYRDSFFAVQGANLKQLIPAN